MDENGELVVQKVIAETGEFKKGVTIYDKVTGEPYCSSVMNGTAQLEPGVCDLFFCISATIMNMDTRVQDIRAKYCSECFKRFKNDY